MVVETLVATLMGFLIKTFKDSKVAGKAVDELSEATWNWIRPIFLKDDEPIADLKKDPEDAINQKLVEATIQKHLKNNPSELERLKALVEKINASSNSSVVTGDNNTVIQGNSGSAINVNAPSK